MTLAVVKNRLAARLATVGGLSTKTLTGTVTKTAASATLTGSGTAFTKDLRVGAVISVPGTATEYFVVTAMASDTSLTLHAAAANNASAQTATQHGVYRDEPDTTPGEAQCPCLVVALPRITPSVPVNDLAQAIYHFELFYLKHPHDLAPAEEATAAMDAYLSDVWTALFGALTLGGNAKGSDFDGDVTRPLVSYRSLWFWGYKIPWRIVEQATVTVTP